MSADNFFRRQVNISPTHKQRQPMRLLCRPTYRSDDFSPTNRQVRTVHNAAVFHYFRSTVVYTPIRGISEALAARYVFTRVYYVDRNSVCDRSWSADRCHCRRADAACGTRLLAPVSNRPVLHSMYCVDLWRIDRNYKTSSCNSE